MPSQRDDSIAHDTVAPVHIAVDGAQGRLQRVQLVLGVGDFRFNLQQVAYIRGLLKQLAQAGHFIQLGLQA